MFILIAGNLGSGKSTVAGVLEKRGYDVYATGAIQRKTAEERGVSILELNELAKKIQNMTNLLTMA